MDGLKMSGPTCGLRTDADTPKGVCPQMSAPQAPPDGGLRGQYADMSTLSAMSALSAIGGRARWSRPLPRAASVLKLQAAPLARKHGGAA